MIYLEKSLRNYNYYLERDLLYKLNKKNSYELNSIDSITLEFKIKSEDEIYSAMSALTLLTDCKPYIIRIKNTLDKKKLKTIIGCKVILKGIEKDSFLMRLSEESIEFLSNFEKLEKDLLKSNKIYTNFSTFIKINNFNEISSHYEEFSNLPNLRLNFHVSNLTGPELLLMLSIWINKLHLSENLIDTQN